MAAECQEFSVERSDHPYTRPDHARNAVCTLVVYGLDETGTDTKTVFQNVHSGEESADIADFLLNIVQDIHLNASRRISNFIATKESKLRTDPGKVCQMVSSYYR